MKTAQIVCLVALVATACGSGPGPIAKTSPATSASPSALSSTPTPTGSPVSSPKSSPTVTGSATATLRCRLPISATAYPGEPPGGWITFPGGKFVRDPASQRDRSGYHLPSYDRAIGAWVPVEYENVSPDGASYVLYRDATTAVPNALYLVDARTGTRRLMPSAQANTKWELVLDYASEGVYLAAPGWGMAPPAAGLWLLDPKSGAIRLINDSHIWSKVSGGIAWSIESVTNNGAAYYKVYRLDLRTGQTASWYETKTAIRPLSPTPEGGLMTIYGQVGSYHIAVITAPKTYVSLKVPADFKLGDAHMTRPGVWLGLTDGIALYTKAEGIRVMAHSAGYVQGGFGFYEAAGGCW